MASRLEGHKYAERLFPDGATLVREMTKNRVQPRHILSTIRNKNPINLGIFFRKIECEALGGGENVDSTTFQVLE
jgi:hypothetical protein